LPGFLASTAKGLWTATLLLGLSALVFGSITLLVRHREGLGALRRMASELRVNLGLFVFDALLIAPVVGLLSHGIVGVVERGGFALVRPETWPSIGDVGTFFTVVFVSDFISYWRHRLEHTRWLWPAHAIHHSDTQVSWLTLARFHPVNRVTTAAVDITCLALVGFPAWALVADQMVRHYYGEFVHADLPWTFGPLKHAVVSPAMHRWHHARDIVGSASNFATVFSVFDRAFGTYHLPGPCNVPLGVVEPIRRTAVGQLAYPFKAWAAALRRPRGLAPGIEASSLGAAVRLEPERPAEPPVR
jgi:sterol desaturase/sphingolipid hydroxylase (fatty acid hydroxylase superfamily)